MMTSIGFQPLGSLSSLLPPVPQGHKRIEGTGRKSVYFLFEALRKGLVGVRVERKY